MEELAQLRASVNATRQVVRGAMRALRTANQFLADLDERLDDAGVPRTAEEAQRHDPADHEDKDETRAA